MSRFQADHDEDAFAELMERHKQKVYGVCWRLLHQRQDAEDACQAAFLALVRKSDSIYKEELVSSWLHGAAVFEAIAILKRRDQRRKHEAQFTQFAQLHQILDEMAIEELLTLLTVELQRLQKKYRDLLILHYLEGRSKAEIAQRLGLKEGTVSSRLATARELLKERLRAFHELIGR